jgi:Fe-S-cluster-containing dehydrogenase component
MKINRKKFLKLATLSFAAAAGDQLVQILRGAEKPQPRWAMAIDLGKCMRDEGCTLCSSACHRVHNVPAIPDPKHAVKWIWKERREKIFPTESAPAPLEGAALPVFCNHCDNPPCTRTCPTGATWKRADGIVMMDFHRCIGCRYCMAACPYGSRSFNWVDPKPFVHPVNPGFPTRTRGVVEKCNFCEERLALGKSPLCVEACPDGALIFGDLKDPASQIHRLLRSRYAVRRRPELGTGPAAFYIVT